MLPIAVLGPRMSMADGAVATIIGDIGQMLGFLANQNEDIGAESDQRFYFCGNSRVE